MKKIALLFSIVCFGQMYGMEPEQGRYIGLAELAPEVQVIIIQALNSYNNLDDVIKAIKAMSLTNSELNAVVNDMYGNPKGFKKLVHILADKFNLTTQIVAEKFKTPAAKEYIKLSKQLGNAVMFNNTEKVINLIEQGADVNSQPNQLPLWWNALTEAQNDSMSMIKLLLANGMQVNKKNDQAAFNILESRIERNRMGQAELLKQIKQLLEDAAQ